MNQSKQINSSESLSHNNLMSNKKVSWMIKFEWNFICQTQFCEASKHFEITNLKQNSI